MIENNKNDEPKYVSPYYRGTGPMTSEDRKDFEGDDLPFDKTDYDYSKEVKDYINDKSPDNITKEDLPTGLVGSESAGEKLSEYYSGRGQMRINEGDSPDFQPYDIGNQDVKKAIEDGTLNPYSEPDKDDDNFQTPMDASQKIEKRLEEETKNNPSFKYGKNIRNARSVAEEFDTIVDNPDKYEE